MTQLIKLHHAHALLGRKQAPTAGSVTWHQSQTCHSVRILAATKRYKPTCRWQVARRQAHIRSPGTESGEGQAGQFHHSFAYGMKAGGRFV